MRELKKLYQIKNLQLQNRLQEIFDSYSFDFNNLYSIADKDTKQRIDTYIEQLKESLIDSELEELADNIYNRKRVKNSEILEFLIYSAYIDEKIAVEDKEFEIFREDINNYYQEGQEEVIKSAIKEEIGIIPETLLFSLLEMPNAKGYIYDDYVNAITKYNANQLYRQVVIDIQQQKTLKIKFDIYQNILKKQQNQKLCINGDKISGDVDLTLIGLNNKAKSEGMYSFDKNAKVRFVAVEDNVTTKMCNSLNDQIFNVHDWNEFERYSESNGKNTKYKCYGLIIGLNMPPIDDHFHWCRSTIQYN